MRANFNNPAVNVQSWYVVARSAAVGRGKVRSFDLLGRKVVLYRAASGRVHVMDARCPHLGANLGHGTVVGEELQCAFHNWRFGPDGQCRAAPGLAEPPQRHVRAYPVQERWGLLWLFNGPEPLFDLPQLPAATRFWTLCPPSQHIRCHPHLVIANGLDAAHFEALHGMDLLESPRLTVEPPYRVTVELRGRPRAPLLRQLTGTERGAISASFTTIGGHLAWTAVQEPIEFYVLFTGRPTATGGCQTQTVFFLPRGLRSLRAFATTYALLRDDRRILDDIAFFPGFTENDAALRAFAAQVNEMKTG
ncbi:MAG: aromatic ring-hydroxylating dioxygenase subunit alpha [Ardenticatenales bacterium]|nr:aromatic ring-hydroxylating dioxygenase subunit alpha [Ardenticatenales bacterium]